MDRFRILQKTEPDWEKFLPVVERHLQTFHDIKTHFTGISGEIFLQGWINVFKETGSPIFVNLDHNVSGKGRDLNELLSKSDDIVAELEMIVKATAGHVSAYKMNEQSMLTFLIAGKPNFVYEAKKLYKDECEDRFGISVVPQIWTDEKLRDIPSTTFQTANIIFALGFDAIHCMPQLGPDVSGALQLAAEKNSKKGIIHVVNMTHNGYKYVKNKYFQSDAIEKMRKDALGNTEFEIDIGKGPKTKFRIRSTGVIEPANRPYEIYQGYKKVYGNKIMILSIGIGPQGALPGCALYSGATCEGIGRFIFLGREGLETFENMRKKSKKCKRGALLSLKARFNSQPYPLTEIKKELIDYNPRILEKTKQDLDKVFNSWKQQ